MNRNTLLIVDDVEINRAILRNLFEKDYNILEAENGEQALLLLHQYRDSITALLLDIIMPVKDGFEVMTDMGRAGLLKNIPVIIITAEDSMESEVRAFDLGASDIVMKPFEPHVVKRRVQNAIELNLHREHLEDLVERQAIKLRESQDVLMDALSSVVEHRNVESGQHILRIRMFTKILLENIMRSYPEYSLNERIINIIASASALHDIGKISIPDAILNKPGPLTAEEFEIMKTHSVKGCEILEGLDRMDDKEYLRYAYRICRYHHERWDGGGYPDGLKGDSIPICAQAAGIADAYDALTTDRVYKKAFTPEKAYTMILNGECGAFSPKLLECFKSSREQFVALTHSYADGHSPKTDLKKLETPPQLQQTEEQDTQLFGQMKYAAMLRCLGATVMEVDLSSEIYHLVYIAGEDFDSLRHGDNYRDSLRNFIEKSVHPDDRAIVSNSSAEYIHDFVDNGLLKRTRKYRVLHRATGAYLWYEAVILRVNIQSPHSHRILIVWKEAGGETQQAPYLKDNSRQIDAIQNLMVAISQCLNDRWFTIRDVNQGFLNLLGYTREEIRDKFHSRYVAMIHPDDREPVMERFKEQLLAGQSIELEYRVTAKDGRIIWVLDKCRISVDEDGTEYLNCVLTDMTQVMQAQEALRLTMERHQIILDQTNDIIFEWDVKGNSINYSPNWEKKFGYKPAAESIPTQIPQASHFFPDDIPKFLALLTKIETGSPYGETELRIANSAGRYIWCRVRATTQFDLAGAPIKAVGVILDIDTEKRRTQELTDKAERDALTGLYNKSAGWRKIQYLLDNHSQAERSAMMIIDLDNFKQINDSFGHMFGDAVLTEISSQLLRLFRSKDVVVRIGGDEFLVFVYNFSDIPAIQARAKRVIEAFHNCLTEELQDTRLSCSIGISCFPDDGTDYQTLFQACDQALYHAKLQGKDRFSMFDHSVVTNAFLRKSGQGVTASTRIESDDSPNLVTYGIIQQAFKMLYAAGDLEMAIYSILEMVGRKYNVSRVYIFEEFGDGFCCANTFEWCNKGITPEIGNLQHVVYDSYLEGKYSDLFNENGVFYCPDISVLPPGLYKMLSDQGIQSLLQCAIRNDGRFAGFVGFDDCSEKRIWTQAQIDALTFISELLSTFLLKMRAQNRAVAMAENLQMVLDNQNSWIYVIDPDSYELKYINAKTYAIAPNAALGIPCYEAFFNRKEPCKRCPARDIRTKINRTMEVFNPLLNVWSLADASFIHWESGDACLLSCHDITPYMEGRTVYKDGKTSE